MNLKLGQIFCVTLFIVSLIGCATSPPVDPEPVTELPPYTTTGMEPRIAILDFTNDSFFQSDVLGTGVAKMVETEFVKSQRFVVLDRKNLEKIVEEQHLSLTGLTQSQMENVGQLLNVDYLISGSVTEFGIKKTGNSVGAGALDLSTGVGGGTTIKKERGTARIAIDLKITKISSGQIIYMGSSVGTAFSENVNLGLGLLTGSGLGAGVNVGQGTIGFDQTIAGLAARDAAKRSLFEVVKRNISWKTN